MLHAQNAENVARERADFAAWLDSAPTSPAGAIARQPIGVSLSLGPDDADLPLTGIPKHQLGEESGRITLSGPDGQRQVRRGVPFRLGHFTLAVDGPVGRVALTVFGPGPRRHPPQYFPYDADVVFVGRLLPPERPGTVRLLGLDGVEVDATEAGSVIVPLGSGTTRLRVRQLPTGGEESEIEIYFRDATNGTGTYPAGRFVPLIPAGNGRYRLDFNRARNPFCAYSSAYPCPAPWRGNTIEASVRAGERYAGGVLEDLPASR